MNKFGNLLKAARIDSGLSQRELAEGVGVNDSYISRIEQGKFGPPSRKVVLAITNKLGITDEAERASFLLAAGYASEEEVLPVEERLSELLKGSQQQLASLQTELEKISKLLDHLRTRIPETVDDEAAEQVVKAVRDSLNPQKMDDSQELPIYQPIQLRAKLPSEPEQFQEQEKIDSIIWRLIGAALDMPILPDNGDTEIFISSQGEKGVFESTLNGFNGWWNTLSLLLKRGWGITHLIRLDNNLTRTIEIIKYIPWLLGGPGQYKPGYMSSQTLRPSQEFIIVPNVGCLVLLGTKQERYIDTAFYYPYSDPHYRMWSNYTQQLTQVSNPLFEVYQTRPAEFDEAIIQIEAKEGERFLVKDGLGANTIPISVDEERIRSISKEKAEIVKTHMASRKKRYAVFLEQLKIFPCREIYAKSAIAHFAQTGEVARDDFITTNGGLKETKQQRIEHLEHIIDLLEHNDNYEIGLLKESTPIRNLYLLGKHDYVVLLKSIPITPESQHEEMSLVISERYITEAFYEYFMKVLWESPSIVTDKRKVLTWLRHQVNTVRRLMEGEQPK